MHRRPHSPGPAEYAGDHQRLLRERRIAVAVEVVGDSRIGCPQACYADSLPDCLAWEEVQEEHRDQKIESFDVFGMEDMRARTWRQEVERSRKGALTPNKSAVCFLILEEEEEGGKEEKERKAPKWQSVTES